MIQELHARAVSAVLKRVPGIEDVVEELSRRRRIEVLDLTLDEDVERWQILHNDTARYEIVAEVFTHLKGSYEGEYKCRITYNEIGEDLPLTKTKSQLRADDNKAKSRIAASGQSVNAASFRGRDAKSD